MDVIIPLKTGVDLEVTVGLDIKYSAVDVETC